jgi:hypothetical protein
MPTWGVRFGSPPGCVYLDTSVLIHIEHALTGTWSPPPVPTKTDRLLMAAARIRFYGYQDRCGWFLVTSGEARRELTGNGRSDWSIGIFFDIDQARDSPHEKDITDLASDYEAEGLKRQDARHLARAALHPPIQYFVTSDEEVLRKAKKLALPGRLRVLGTLEAEKLLQIQPRETPPVTPVPGSQLERLEPWWIPR